MIKVCRFSAMVLGAVRDCEALRSDVPSYHRLKVVLSETPDKPKLRVMLCCNYQDAGFEEWQSFDTERLAAEAKAILESGRLDEALHAAGDSGIEVVATFT